jgi:8-hydroxy-5-deazaflavin:NADPH oxidoreductase
MEIDMSYAIIGSGLVGATLARFFAAKDIAVLIANSRGPETLRELTAELGRSVKAVTIDEAVEADIILVAVGALAFKDVGALLRDWSGKIIIDVTNGFMLPPAVQQAEYQGRLTSEVNAERVPGAKLVKAFNQLPLTFSPARCPTLSAEGSCSFRATTRMQVPPSRLSRKALALRRSKSARLPKAAA